MFGRKKKPEDLSPEVKEAIGRRDEVLSELKDAVAQVDRLQDELLDSYIAAEKRRRAWQWT